MIGDWNQEDGVLKLIPQAWRVSGMANSTKGVEDIIAKNIEEVDDELMVVGKPALYDNYVRSGELKEGQLTLNLGEDKTANIDLSQLNTEAISEKEIEEAAGF